MSTRTFTSIKYNGTKTNTEVNDQLKLLDQSKSKSKSKSISIHDHKVRSTTTSSHSEKKYNDDNDDDTESDEDIKMSAGDFIVGSAETFLEVRSIIHDVAKQIKNPVKAEQYIKIATERVSQAIDSGIEPDRVYEIPMNEFTKATGGNPYQNLPEEEETSHKKSMSWLNVLNSLGSLASLYIVYHIHYHVACQCE